MFDSEIRGQLCMLMGGRAAEQITCTSVSTGAVDDIRRATDLANKSVTEFGLSLAVGPMNVGVLAAGSGEDGAWLLKDNGNISKVVESEVKRLLESSLQSAVQVLQSNRVLHEGLSKLLMQEERVEGDVLQKWLEHVEVRMLKYVACYEFFVLVLLYFILEGIFGQQGPV